MFRRTFLKGLLGSIAALFVSKTKAVPVVIKESVPVLPKGFVARPGWCPEGWLPVMGQTIMPEQFPKLFERQAIDGAPGRTFIPPYWGQSFATLSEYRPTALTDLERAGIWGGHDPRLTRLPLKDDSFVTVTLIATEPQKWPSGKKISPPGFYSTLTIRRGDFEKDYGPIAKVPDKLRPDAYMALYGDHKEWNRGFPL